MDIGVFIPIGNNGWLASIAHLEGGRA